ncbi:NAD(P)-dependent oxidoreductase [Actinomadura viridis]|uniref:3-hydroxyisobutyrate dehydrogenase-like beta-hydroxyacid dehydrogenase n=1 Tax=Actinomadura viridis TaxID=58110 RepID=A0A931GMC2_9ACTN|nr:NAD(P)-binding domain-containing protein [Actinomadura viridis]MBG6091880.1 3-hydroxyisobutyrate dehydrogenase-like beta-hydroxyacid dehydrogenase [Actinomadura viridis]
MTAQNLAPVTVIGLGPMGATMAETFLANGHPTTVWNRTAAKAEPLVAKGATHAPTPADALAAAELVVISQIDYRAMYDSLGPATDALKGRVLVNLSSGSPAELRAAGEWAAAHGADLVTGGIMVPPPGIGKPGSYVFYSGPEDVLGRHRDALQVLGDISHVGEDHGLAMLYYQAQLFIFWSTLTSYMHATALLGTAGVSAGEFRPFAAQTVRELAEDGPMGFLKILTEEMEARTYPGELNSLRMQAVGMDHVVEASCDAGIDTALPSALRDLFARGVAEGYGDDGLGSVFEVIRKPAAQS